MTQEKFTKEISRYKKYITATQIADHLMLKMKFEINVVTVRRYINSEYFVEATALKILEAARFLFGVKLKEMEQVNAV